MKQERSKSLIDDLQDSLSRLKRETDLTTLPAAKRRELERGLRTAASELSGFLAAVDPVRQPHSTFDPSDPRVVARFISIALVSQPRSDLQSLVKFYGSGVYALYYTGDFPLYAELSNAETPIYVGQAAPAISNARTPTDQGERLFRRLEEHGKSISRAANLKLTDFEYRCLVIQSGWEGAAEKYLIGFFQPIWNSEVKILYGIGKHGDKASTRANKRSPWDTLHPGRQWAVDTAQDARDIARIDSDVRLHFQKTPPFSDMEGVLSCFIDQLRQS